jgi:RimJ/RimL family protein N-acetyltransferase
MEKAKTFRIETNRLIIRCYRMEDAPMVSDAITRSLDHLRPWMPWAKDQPAAPAATIKLVTLFRDTFYSGEDSFFGIFNKAETALIGSTGLHPRIGARAREIGYWINVDHVRQGYATETVAALLKIGFIIEDLERIEIRCDPNNLISQKIPKALGFKNTATLKNIDTDVNGKPRDTMIWSLLLKDYAHRPPQTMNIKAFDRDGQEIFFKR